MNEPTGYPAVEWAKEPITRELPMETMQGAVGAELDPDIYYPGRPMAVQNAQLADLLEKKSSAERKKYPVFTGFIAYFRDAIYRAARVSYEGNEKHNPGTPTHWARGKSDDHEDCLARHMMSGGDYLSAEYEEHLANAFWRAGARLQLYLEKKYCIKPPPGAK